MTKGGERCVFAIEMFHIPVLGGGGDKNFYFSNYYRVIAVNMVFKRKQKRIHFAEQDRYMGGQMATALSTCMMFCIYMSNIIMVLA